MQYDRLSQQHLHFLFSLQKPFAHCLTCRTHADRSHFELSLVSYSSWRNALM